MPVKIAAQISSTGPITANHGQKVLIHWYLSAIVRQVSFIPESK